MSMKKKIIYILVFVLIGIVVGVGYWVYTVGSANIWNGSGTVEQENSGTVKEDNGHLYVEIYVDKYETITGTLILLNNGTFVVQTNSGTVSPASKDVVAVKSTSDRLITERNARWYRNKKVQVVMKQKEKLLINPEESKNVDFIDPTTGKKISPDMLKSYSGKQIIVVRKMTKPAVWLVAGIDSRNGILYGHNDSVMLVFVNPETASITVLSIPRDTIVYIPRLRSYTKLAHAFIYSKAGEPEDGAKSLIETLEYNFGVHIDRYIIFSFKGVADVVDAIGGIDIHLDKRICCHSHDWACRGGTCLGPGDVHLDGRKFLVFWRSRTSDIERVERQMSFLTSEDIKKQVIDKLSLSLADDLIKIWGSEVVSDTSPDKWIKLAYDIRNYHVSADMLKVYDVWGCYAADLTVKVSAVKYDDSWLKDFYVKVFGPDLASKYIEGIHPDRTVAQLGHCVEEKEESETSSTSSVSKTSTSTQGSGSKEGIDKQTTTTAITSADASDTHENIHSASTSQTSTSSQESATATVSSGNNTSTTTHTSTASYSLTSSTATTGGTP